MNEELENRRDAPKVMSFILLLAHDVVIVPDLHMACNPGATRLEGPPRNI